MKTNLKFGLVAVLGVSVLFAAIVTGTTSFVDGSDYGLNLFSSGDYVYPGIGFEDIGEPNENFIAAYGIWPSEEMRTDEWSEKLYDTDNSLKDDLYDRIEATLTWNYIIYGINESGDPTWAEVREACIANDIDTSGLIKYALVGECNTLIYTIEVEDGFIHIGLNMDEDVNESMRNEIYGLYYQRGKELGIDDIPVVFYVSEPYPFSYGSLQ
jgi:hypothetical protein